MLANAKEVQKVFGIAFLLTDAVFSKCFPSESIEILPEKNLQETFLEAKLEDFFGFFLVNSDGVCSVLSPFCCCRSVLV